MRIRPPIVLVFVQSGCGYCGEYMRRFKPVAAKHPDVPVRVGDISQSPHARKLADHYRVQATPATVAIGRGGTHKVEGAVGAAEIKNLFGSL